MLHCMQITPSLLKEESQTVYDLLDYINIHFTKQERFLRFQLIYGKCRKKHNMVATRNHKAKDFPQHLNLCC